ncbi:MAG: hypothetical protein BWY63_00003 [Chloroflexi bacterium ADurb.Bin360]|nr:MAG: hypothetical protein BWY63_00003 [Chloroflexi bacterium ADurb.Bin360]
MVPIDHRRRVSYGDVQITVAVHIAPSQAGGADTHIGCPDNAGVKVAVGIAIRHIGLLSPVEPHRQVRVAVVIHIAQGQARDVCFRETRPPGGGSIRRQIVHIELARLTDIAHGQIKVAVAIHVTPGHAAGVAAAYDLAFRRGMTIRAGQVDGGTATAAYRDIEVAIVVGVAQGCALHRAAHASQIHAPPPVKIRKRAIVFIDDDTRHIPHHQVQASIIVAVISPGNAGNICPVGNMARCSPDWRIFQHPVNVPINLDTLRRVVSIFDIGNR